MSVGVHVPLRFLRAAIKKGAQILKGRLPVPGAKQTSKVLEPVYAHIPRNSNVHANLRQKIAGRWYSTAVKNFLQLSAAPTRAARGPSVNAAVARSATSPFASALRPRLTGGAFPRTASGYSLGGGARYFSHSPAAPAQVMQQVSAAMRAFLYSGKGQMDGYRRHDGKTGRIGVRAQLAASLAQGNAPGAYIDFDLSPTLTCISPLSGRNNSLENEEFLSSLSADFGTIMSSIVAIHADIRRLSILGDLPVSAVGPTGDIIRVHFRGCDKDFVERLCDEVGVSRGVIHEDERFAFGFLAPGNGVASWREMMSDSPPPSSTYSEDGFEDDFEDVLHENDSHDELKSRISGSDDWVHESDYFEPAGERPVFMNSPGYSTSSSQNYDGIQGIHRFLEECGEYRLNAWSD